MEVGRINAPHLQCEKTRACLELGGRSYRHPLLYSLMECSPAGLVCRSRYQLNRFDHRKPKTKGTNKQLEISSQSHLRFLTPYVQEI